MAEDAGAIDGVEVEIGVAETLSAVEEAVEGAVAGSALVGGRTGALETVRVAGSADQGGGVLEQAGLASAVVAGQVGQVGRVALGAESGHAETLLALRVTGVASSPAHVLMAVTETSSSNKWQTTEATRAVGGNPRTGPAKRITEITNLRTFVVTVTARTSVVGEVAVGLASDAGEVRPRGAGGARVVARSAQGGRRGESEGIVELAEADAVAEDNLAVQRGVAEGADQVVSALLAKGRAGEAGGRDPVVVVARRAPAQTGGQEAVRSRSALEAGRGGGAVLAVVGAGQADRVGAVVVEAEGASALGAVEVPVHARVALSALRGGSVAEPAQHPALQAAAVARVLEVVGHAGTRLVDECAQDGARGAVGGDD